MTIPLQHIYERAKDRPPGYVEDVLGAGVVEGDAVVLTDDAYAHLVAKYNPPSVLAMAGSAVMAAGKWAAAGLPEASQEQLAKRQAECRACDRWDSRAERCLECGCYTQIKLRMATERCPLGRWSAVTPQ